MLAPFFLVPERAAMQYRKDSTGGVDYGPMTTEKLPFRQWGHERPPVKVKSDSEGALEYTTSVDEAQHPTQMIRKVRRLYLAMIRESRVVPIVQVSYPLRVTPVMFSANIYMFKPVKS